MSLSFGVAAVAALVALVFTGMLVHRCIRVPRLDLAAAACATLGLTVALAAQALGYHRGFTPTTFRAVHLGAQLLAPMALAWALAEMTGKSLGGRFAARLALGGLTMVAAVVLASDPLSAAPFTAAWPAASVYYQLIPKAILELVAAVTAFSAVLALLIAAVRARRYPGWRELFLAVLAAALAILATEGLRVSLPANSGYVAICLITAALAWFAATRASRVRLDVLRFGGPVWDEDTGEFVQYNEDTGEFAPYTDDTEYALGPPGAGGYAAGQGDARSYPGAQGDGGYTGWFRDDTGEFHSVGSESDLAGWFRDDTGGFGRDVSDTGSRAYGTDSDLGSGQHRNGTNGHGAAFETGDLLPPASDYPAVPDEAPGEAQQAQFYGQIAIYTLLDGRTEEFDQLAQRVVEQVKREPGTLVYVMHGVPSAPMQRILYEVYRDGPAFDEHVRQPYIQRFEAERSPCVLATNVIELGVRHAKFMASSAPPRPTRDEAVRRWGNAAL